MPARHSGRVLAQAPTDQGRDPVPGHRKACKRRNVIERMWRRLKNWRRIATRHDRLARNDLASLALVSAAGART